jgi:hypothetical protein
MTVRSKRRSTFCAARSRTRRSRRIRRLLFANRRNSTGQLPRLITARAEIAGIALSRHLGEGAMIYKHAYAL